MLSLNVINTVLHASETHGLNKCLNALNLGFSTVKSGVWGWVPFTSNTSTGVVPKNDPLPKLISDVSVCACVCFLFVGAFFNDIFTYIVK